MKKLIFENLSFEITRKCNMRCGHCMRGAPQNVDLSREDIDGILSQAKMIGMLYLTGGEPTLRLDTVEYILRRVKELGIPVFYFVLATNGLRDPAEVVPIVKAWSEYVRVCNQTWKDIDRSGSDFVGLRISSDQYHSQSDLVRQHFSQYTVELAEAAKTTLEYMGAVPFRIGRAKELNHSETVPRYGEELLYNRQITILDKDHKPFCLSHSEYILRNPDDVIVCCKIYVTARGNIIPYWIGTGCEYDEEDLSKSIICKVDEPLYESIFQFNKNKLNCFEWYRWAASDFQNNIGDKGEHINQLLRLRMKHPEAVFSQRPLGIKPHATLLPEDMMALKNLEPRRVHKITAFLEHEILCRDFTKPYVAPDKRLAATRATVDRDMFAIRAVWAAREEEETNN